MLQPTATLECRVIDLQGKPVAEADVYAQGDAIGKRQLFGKTDKNGKVSISGLPPGEYFVDALKISEGYPRHFGRIYDTEKRVWQLVKVTSAATLPLTFQLGPKCGILELTIEGPDGKPDGGSVKISRVDRADLGSLTSGHSLSGYQTYLLPPDVLIRIQVGPDADREGQYAVWQSDPIRAKPGDRLKWKIKFGKQQTTVQRQM